jgi:hypothetical protein
MSTYSIIVTNNAPGCNNDITQQLSVSGCSSYIVRLSSTSNALGPFNVYIDSILTTPIYSAQTRTQMLNGVVVTFECVTPTPTPTPTPTSAAVTPTNTPTNTETPTVTPTNSATPGETPTQTPTPSITASQTQTPTPSVTTTQTATVTPSITASQTPSQTQTPTPSITASQTQTPTPSITASQTQTPTPSITASQTQSPTPTKTQTPTPTYTQTPSPSAPQSLPAYLFIEPTSANTQFSGYFLSVSSPGVFRGFSNGLALSTNPVTYNVQMNNYIQFSGWGGTAPLIGTGTTSSVSGGNDAYGNPITAYLFQTYRVPAGTVAGDAWYTWIVPTASTNNQIISQIGYNNAGNPNSLTAVNTQSSIYNLTVTTTGSTIPVGVYRVYSTYTSPTFRINGSVNDIYFKGNTLI